MTSPMQLRVEHDDAAARIVVSGELDLATAGKLRDALTAELGSGRPLLLDLETCTFIDSVGLGVLVEIARRAQRDGPTSFAVVSPSAPVRRLLELTQLESLIPVFDSAADAVARLATNGTVA